MTQIRNTTERYGWMASSLHWIIGLSVIALLCVGLYMVTLKPSPQLFQLYALHKSIGVTVLVLAIVRVLWKSANIHPSALASHAAWEKKLSNAVHLFLYACLFIMPLSGWIMSSAKGFSVSVFGLFTLPDLVAPDKSLAETAVQIHNFTAYGLIAAVLLHAAGAFKHALIDRDSTLARMIPFLRMSVVVGLLFAPAAALAQSTLPQWTIDKDKSHITFEGKQMGAPFEGEFSEFGGTVAFDADHLDQSSIKVTIQTGSISTRSPDRDQAVIGKDWFDVTAFPQAVFTADKFEKVDDTHFIALGSLKIRDVSVPVKLPFALTIEPGSAGQKIAHAKGETELNRFDFGLGGDQWKDENSVGASVKVTINVTATDTPLIAEKH